MLAVDDLTVGYAGQAPVLSDVSLRLEAGEGLLVCGAGGAGKTTLLAAAGGIIPRLTKPATLSGRVSLGGTPLSQLAGPRLFSRVSFVFQALEDQLWNIGVEDLIAFPLENRRMARGEIRARIEQALRLFGLGHLRGRLVLTLSGGERRLVALAAAMTGGPELLILDDPTTGLDPTARIRLTQALRDVGRDAPPPAMLAADQDASSLAPALRHVAFLAHGRLSAPQPLANLGGSPLWRQSGIIAPGQRLPNRGGERGAELLVATGLRSRRTRGDAAVLRDVSFAVRAGEVVGLIGPNGAGKTTLFQTLLGLLGQAAGGLTIAGEDARGWTAARRARLIGYLPQTMRRLLFNMSVLEEAAFAVAGDPQRTGDAAVRQTALAVLERYGLGGKAEVNPFALSAREQGLLGLACVEGARCRIAILDEPLLARDLYGRQMLGRFLATLRAAGRAAILISHDLELVDDVADRVLILREGVIACAGPAAEAWRSPSFAALGWDPPARPPVLDAA